MAMYFIEVQLQEEKKLNLVKFVVEGSVRETVAQVQKHPLIPKDITVRGFVIDSTTGELATVV